MRHLKEKLWDYTFGDNRSYEEWVLLLYTIRDSLQEFLGLSVIIEDYWVDDEDGASHSCIRSSIKIIISEPICEQAISKTNIMCSLMIVN